MLAVAAVSRCLLLASQSISFHSDEAIVGLMARHILANERPTFFYGQAYMGSLDAWFVALGFRLLGESVQTIRLVQSALYLVVVITAYYAAWVLSRRVNVATICALTFAIPPVLVALYTTATLGGYNETLIAGHLVVALGYSAAHTCRGSWFRWLMLGIVAGIGWWVNALIVIYALPTAVYLLHRTVRGDIEHGALMLTAAGIGFLLGSSPWWVFAIQNDWMPLRFFLPDVLGGREVVGAVIPSVPIGDRLVGMFAFGLPAVIGMRFPWAGDYFAPGAGVVVLLIALSAVITLLSRSRRPTNTGDNGLMPGASSLMLGIILVLGLLFLGTRFSSDPSGRYFLPLTLPLGAALGAWIDTRTQRAAAYAALIFVLGYYGAGQVTAANTPSGMTTQFVAQTHLPNSDDTALIAWLNQQNIRHGYSTYWVSFRLAFLSREHIQFSAALPDKSDLVYTPAFERYPPYRAATDAEESVAFVTANVPELDSALRDWFCDLRVTFDSDQVGIFTIYHDFAPYPPRPPLPFLSP